VPLLVYGAKDEKAGAVDTHFQICNSDKLNHRVQVVSGILETECRELMQEFFKGRRQKSDVSDQMSESDL
jgi:tRNA(adenine34) deaminase